MCVCMYTNTKCPDTHITHISTIHIHIHQTHTHTAYHISTHITHTHNTNHIIHTTDHTHVHTNYSTLTDTTHSQNPKIHKIYITSIGTYNVSWFFNFLSLLHICIKKKILLFPKNTYKIIKFVLHIVIYAFVFKMMCH